MFKRKVAINLLLITCCTLFFISPIGAADATDKTNEVDAEYYLRVAIFRDAGALNLAITGPYKIFALYTNELLASGKNLRPCEIKPVCNGIIIDDKEYKIVGVKIRADKDANIFLNRRCFRGDVDILRTEKVKLLVVNHLNIESYLYGVLHQEASNKWPMEALKTQAVISRTFALYTSLISKENDYDVTNDFYSQVYGGRHSERWKTSLAVNATRGEVMVTDGKVFPAYYHSTCGGHTESADKIWNIDAPSLKSVSCDFCVNSPHYSWDAKLNFKDIQAALKKSGYIINGSIQTIETEGYDESNRIINIKIISDKSSLTINANKFRLALGPFKIKSTNFLIKDVKDGCVYIEGKGWGHGVGLCQWGAFGMAKKRYKYKDILSFYYKNAQIETIKTLLTNNKEIPYILEKNGKHDRNK